MPHNLYPAQVAILVPMFALAVPLVALLYRRYLEIRYGRALIVALAAAGIVLVPVGIMILRSGNGRAPLSTLGGDPDMFFPGICLLALAGLPLLLWLYGRWLGDSTTEAERTPGAVSLRAWLRAGNLICVALVALGLWMVFDYSFATSLVLGLMVLLAYPFFISVGAEASPPPPPAPPSGSDLSEERQQVLRMLESGKIGSEEAAELLRALGETVEPDGTAPMGRRRSKREKLVLSGAIIVLIGFLLPWLTIDVGQEVERMQNAVANPVAQAFGRVSPVSIEYRHSTNGAGVTHGRGWLILASAIGIAWLTLVARPGGASLPGWLPGATWAVGAALIFSLVASDFRFLSFGLLVVVAGFALLAAGIWHRSPAVASHSAVEPARG